MALLTVLVQNKHIASVQVDGVSCAEAGHCRRWSVHGQVKGAGGRVMLTAATNNNDTGRGHLGSGVRVSGAGGRVWGERIEEGRRLSF